MDPVTKAGLSYLVLHRLRELELIPNRPNCWCGFVVLIDTVSNKLSFTQGDLLIARVIIKTFFEPGIEPETFRDKIKSLGNFCYQKKKKQHLYALFGLANTIPFWIQLNL